MTPDSEPSGGLPADDAQINGSRTTGADPQALHALIMDQLDQDQADEIVSIPLAGISSIADYMVIASGRSSRHVAAMAEKIGARIKQELHGTARVEGLATADWVLIDAGDVIVHLFRPEVRSFYNLEKMWGADGAGQAASPPRA